MITLLVAYGFIILCVGYFIWFFGLIIHGSIKAGIKERDELKNE